MDNITTVSTFAFKTRDGETIDNRLGTWAMAREYANGWASKGIAVQFYDMDEPEFRSWAIPGVER